MTFGGNPAGRAPAPTAPLTNSSSCFNTFCGGAAATAAAMLPVAVVMLDMGVAATVDTFKVTGFIGAGAVVVVG